MVYRKEWTSAKCRCCLSTNELDTFHIFQCPNKELRLTRNLLFSNLLAKLKQLDTDPNIISIYSNVLFSSSTSSWDDPLLVSAFLDLQRLGSKQILHGLIPTSILKVQERYLKDKRSSYRKWGINVISSLLLLSHCLWKVQCNIVYA